MRLLKYAVIPALLCLAAGAGESSSDQADRVLRIERKLMAPCCWAGNLVDHRSEIALQMKKEIALWVAQGKTDREILDTYKQRYGARILAEPEGPARVWLNAVPALVILTGFVLVLLLLRRWRRVRPSHA